MDDFKIGARVACYVTHGSYSAHWREPETIIRETKSCWITDKGSQIRKDTHAERGYHDSFGTAVYRLWTNEMEIKYQQALLRKPLEEEIMVALKHHKFTITQLQYIKTMLDR